MESIPQRINSGFVERLRTLHSDQTPESLEMIETHCNSLAYEIAGQLGHAGFWDKHEVREAGFPKIFTESTSYYLFYKSFGDLNLRYEIAKYFNLSQSKDKFIPTEFNEIVFKNLPGKWGELFLDEIQGKNMDFVVFMFNSLFQRNGITALDINSWEKFLYKLDVMHIYQKYYDCAFLEQIMLESNVDLRIIDYTNILLLSYETIRATPEAQEVPHLDEEQITNWDTILYYTVFFNKLNKFIRFKFDADRSPESKNTSLLLITFTLALESNYLLDFLNQKYPLDTKTLAVRRRLGKITLDELIDESVLVFGSKIDTLHAVFSYSVISHLLEWVCYHEAVEGATYNAADNLISDLYKKSSMLLFPKAVATVRYQFPLLFGGDFDTIDWNTYEEKLMQNLHRTINCFIENINMHLNSNEFKDRFPELNGIRVLRHFLISEKNYIRLLHKLYGIGTKYSKRRRLPSFKSIKKYAENKNVTPFDVYKWVKGNLVTDIFEVSVFLETPKQVELTEGNGIPSDLLKNLVLYFEQYSDFVIGFADISHLDMKYFKFLQLAGYITLNSGEMPIHLLTELRVILSTYLTENYTTHYEMIRAGLLTLAQTLSLSHTFHPRPRRVTSHWVSYEKDVEVGNKSYIIKYMAPQDYQLKLIDVLASETPGINRKNNNTLLTELYNLMRSYLPASILTTPIEDAGMLIDVSRYTRIADTLLFIYKGVALGHARVYAQASHTQFDRFSDPYKSKLTNLIYCSELIHSCDKLLPQAKKAVYQYFLNVKGFKLHEISLCILVASGLLTPVDLVQISMRELVNIPEPDDLLNISWKHEGGSLLPELWGHNKLSLTEIHDLVSKTTFPRVLEQLRSQYK